MFDCTEYRKKNYFLINQLSFFSLYSNKTSLVDDFFFFYSIRNNGICRR